MLTLLFVILGAVWGGFLGVRQLAGAGSWLDQLENLSVDWRYSLAGPREPPRGVVIAAIDEDTIRQAGSFPLPRKVLAEIVRGLARYIPQVICLDMLLLDPGVPETDQELADALRATRTVIGAVGISPSPCPGNGLWCVLRDGPTTAAAQLACRPGRCSAGRLPGSPR